MISRDDLNVGEDYCLLDKDHCKDLLYLQHFFQQALAGLLAGRMDGWQAGVAACTSPYHGYQKLITVVVCYTELCLCSAREELPPSSAARTDGRTHRRTYGRTYVPRH